MANLIAELTWIQSLPTKVRIHIPNNLIIFYFFNNSSRQHMILGLSFST